MQPPLYYLVAAPAFAAVGDHRDKVFAVRVLDLALLLLGTWLVWRLARRLAGADAAIGVFAVAATVLLWPGVVVRGITIGNTPLEIVLASAFMLALWRADGEGRLRPALAAAVLLGLCLLTKFSLFYLVPLFALVLARRLWRAPSRRGLVEAAALAAIPVALLAPWLASNLSRYGSLTVSISGGKGIAPPVDAGGILDRATNLPDLDARLLEGSLAQEFLPQLAVPWVEVAAKGLVVALAAAALATLVAGGRRWRTWFLALPALTGLAIMQLTYLLTGDAPFLLRYIYPALLPLALAIGLEAAERGGMARRAIVPACALATVVAGALWIDVAGAYYFTDLGDKLGI
jgi:4-amino-4-deoxy-L-arabinose transferase-like glycosyltransferase